MSSQLSSLGGVLVLAASLVACADDELRPCDGLRKGRIDRPTLEAGVTVTVADDLGIVLVPFLVPVPFPLAGDTGGEEDMEAELGDAVSLVATSPNTGASADLMLGAVVEALPQAPGEWAWELDDARLEATLTFFNATTSGLSLTAGIVYDAALTIATNTYIEEEGSFSFPVMVVEQ